MLGIDAAPDMVSLTAAEAVELGLDRVEVRLGDADYPPGVDGEYNVVLAGLVLFFLPDLAGALARYARLLKPGGLIAFSWFSEDDARWEPVMEAIDAFAPAGSKRRNSTDRACVLSRFPLKSRRCRACCTRHSG